MNCRHITLKVVLFCTLPAVADAIELGTIDRSIKREPNYQTESPGYCLVVFGNGARTRVWLVVDGRRLYVDRNGNGDLTEPNELVGIAKPGYKTSIRSFVVDKIKETDRTTLHRDLNLHVDENRQFRLAVKLAIGGRQFVGYGSQATKPRLAHRPQDAPIVHLNGPTTFATYGPISFLTRGKQNSLRVMIGSRGLGAGTFAGYDRRALLGVAGDGKLAMEMELRGRVANAAPFTVRDHLTVRDPTCVAGYLYCEHLSVPKDAGAGCAKIKLSLPDGNEGDVSPCTLKSFMLGDPQDVPTVVSLLQDPDKLVHSATVRAVVRNNQTVMPSLVVALKTSARNRELLTELVLAVLRKKGLRYESGELTKVGVNRQDVIDNDLKWLSDSDVARDLTSLNLYRTRITDDGLRHLKDLPALTSLNLANNAITNDGLRHLADLPKSSSLSSLGLGNTRITDDGLVHLKKLTGLKKLYLWNTRVTSKGLMHLADMPQLTHVGLGGTQISGAGLKHIEGLRHLTYLSLGRTQVGDDGIVHLKKIKNLTFLDLRRTGMTSSGVAELSRQIPGVAFGE